MPMSETENFIEVCAAVIRHDSRVLLARRPPDSHLAGLWEFPGGKVHDGESLSDCIRREIREELGRHIEVHDHVATIDHQYPEKNIRLHFFECSLVENDDQCPSAEWEYDWFDSDEVLGLELAPADRRFVVG